MKLIYNDIFLKHEVEPECPEKPERLQYLMESVPFLQEGLARLEQGFPDSTVVRAPNGKVFLELFHTPEYIATVRETCAALSEGDVQEGETSLSHYSFKAACYAVGAAVQGARLAQRGEKSLALVRPPGHHAHADHAAGFCIFNNVAIAAEYLRQKGERVMIVDVDLHLGDGTLEYVEGKENVFYFSLNHENIYPHLEPGNTENTENIFLPAQVRDDDYIAVLEERLVPRLRHYDPSIIAVSAGFDTHSADYLHHGESFGGGFLLTHKSYKKLWDILDQEVRPYFIVLEGGYDPMSVLDGVLSFVDKGNKDGF